jgi:hypothetical protein
MIIDRALLIEAAVRQKAERTVRSYRPFVSIRSPGPTSLQQTTRRPGSICPRSKTALRHEVVSILKTTNFRYIACMNLCFLWLTLRRRHG